MFRRRSQISILLAVFMLATSNSARCEPASLAPIEVTQSTPNKVCLDCHGVQGFAVPKGETGQAPKRHLFVNGEAFAGSAHGSVPCVGCHADIKELPHAKDVKRAVDCIQCHADTAKTQTAGTESIRIGNVIHQTRDFLASIHARPSKDDPSRPNATCVDCHSAHSVFPVNTKTGAEFRLSTPEVCGRCHWFGVASLLPNVRDFKDFISMMKWFLGRGPRPAFDHWTYWEKFDYWALFWGMVIIGLSGLSLLFPEVTASYLPGWVFNAATILHGEEAFLAAVFLFTVHYFNSHFRPTKLPQDITMFTGTVPLHEFIEERGLEYKRLVESGKLESVLVDPPGRGQTRAAQILGAVLIIAGLLLLLMVLQGFWSEVLFG